MLAAVAAAACGGKRAARPEEVASCIHEHGGVAALSPNPAAESRGIPGHVTAGIDFNFPAQAGVLNVGFVFFERSDHDAKVAYDAVRRGRLTVPKIPGVDLAMLPKAKLVEPGQVQRHGNAIVLWLATPTKRGTARVNAVASCLAR